MISLNLIPLAMFPNRVIFWGQLYVASHSILLFAFCYVQMFSTGVNPNINFAVHHQKNKQK